MMTRNLTKRLERLEAELKPSDEPVLTITVTCIGEPDRIIEMRGLEPKDRRRAWPWNRGGGR